MQLESRNIRVGDINTHYLVSGSGPPLILIHGGGSVGAEKEWQANFQSLARYHTVYAPDLVGYGKSDKPKLNYTLKLFNSFFEQFLDSLAFSEVSLLGHSLGGGIALDYTLKFPDRVKKLVLVDTIGLSDEIGAAGKLLFPLFITIARMRGDHTFVSLMTGGNGGEPVEVYMNRLHEISTPTLLLWGRWDGYVPVKLAYLANQKLPNSDIHIFKWCWHAPQKQKSNEFNRIVTEFLCQQAE